MQPQGDAACKGRDRGPGGEPHQGDPTRSAAPLSNQLGLGNLPLAMCLTQSKTEDTVSQRFLRTRPWPPPAGTASQASVPIIPAPGWQLPALAPGHQNGHREKLPENCPEEATSQECDWSPTNTRPCPSLATTDSWPGSEPRKGRAQGSPTHEHVWLQVVTFASWVSWGACREPVGWPVRTGRAVWVWRWLLPTGQPLERQVDPAWEPSI